MRIAITGASGLIGSALASSLRNDGHEVLEFVRRAARQPHEISWNPATGAVDTSALHGIDAVVHLAGAGVGDRRWNAAYKRTILESRVLGTQTIARAVAQAGVPVLISGSAMGYYGDTGATAVDESAPRGAGFLAEVVEAWEAAAAPAIESGVRVAFIRTGLVMTPRGGALSKMLPLFKLGLGGRLGTGRQYWSTISLRDEVAAIKFLIEHDVRGPFNLVAPASATNAEFTRSLAAALRRPALLPVPAIALKLVLGEFSSEVLGSQRVIPTRLLEAGFKFKDASLDAITASVI